MACVPMNEERFRWGGGCCSRGGGPSEPRDGASVLGTHLAEEMEGGDIPIYIRSAILRVQHVVLYNRVKNDARHIFYMWKCGELNR